MQLRWGIIGLGRHCTQVVIPAMHEAEGAALLAVASEGGSYLPDLKKLAQPDLSIYRSYQELLEDGRIDAIYICLPNHLHTTWCIKSLEAGKHVLCEKPLAISQSDCLKIRAAAEGSGKKVLEGFMYRFHPQHQEVLKLLRENQIGTVLLLEAHFHYFLDDLCNIRLKPECGGGALFDVGCYLVDCSRFLMGMLPAKVSAQWKVGAASGVDEFTAVQLGYEGGAVAHLVSGVCLMRQNSYAIYGTKGKLTLKDAFRIPRNKAGAIELETIDGRKRTISVPPCNQAALEITRFGEWVGGKAVDSELFGDGVENLRLLEVIAKSARRGETLCVDNCLVTAKG